MARVASIAAVLVAAALPGLQIDAALAQQPSCKSERTRIVGGDRARIEDWPAQAALRLHSETGQVSHYFCGGTAISERWVLTAAHCLPDYLSTLVGPVRDSKDEPHEGRLEVVIGAGDLRKVRAEQVFAVEQVVVHESYRAAIEKALRAADPVLRQRALERIAPELGDDVALLRLARPWSGRPMPLSLAKATDPATPPGTQVRVAGYGTTEHSADNTAPDRFDRADGKGELLAGSALLLETAVETVATPKCKRRYAGYTVGDGQVCAGLEQGGKDACQGDSGGPLIATDARGCPRQIGVVSWGDNCAMHEAYGVYTRVSHYAAWIQKHTGPLERYSPAPEAGAGNALTVSQLDEALRHLDRLLGPTKRRVRIGVKGGNRVTLGHKVVFEAASEVAGRLLILDINANREVLPLYPNKFVAAGDIGRIEAGQPVLVPGPDYPGFSAFQAVEPVGVGRLLALVVPHEFDIERFAAGKAIRQKGFMPVDDAPNHLMRIIRQIDTTLGARPGGSADAEELKRWGYALAEYEIVR